MVDKRRKIFSTFHSLTESEPLVQFAETVSGRNFNSENYCFSVKMSYTEIFHEFYFLFASKSGV